MPSFDKAALACVLRSYPFIEAAYVFGSAATGRQHRESDLDLAVVAREGEEAALRSGKLDLLADLVRHGFDELDLVLFHEADLVLQYEAIRLNKLVYRTESFDHGVLYSRTIRRYFDVQPLLKQQRAAYKRRLVRDDTESRSTCRHDRILGGSR